MKDGQSELARQLTPVSPQGLRVFANLRDALSDMFVYLEYLRGRQVKRMVRSNEIPNGDLTRLVKLMGETVNIYGWVGFIDQLALYLGLVHYDTQGVYRGNNSVEPSFPDNHIQVVEKECQGFMALSPAAQEKKLLNALVVQRQRSAYDSSNNEFYVPGVLSRLDGFSTYGSATGVMPALDFTSIRRFLLGLLQKCDPGVWYSTASLVAYLKAQHPYFLIPQNIPPDRFSRTSERYSNFHEGPERWTANAAVFVPADAPDAFERVEGRYVERFLEGIPLILRFVEVAYSLPGEQNVYPSLGLLPAFRVTERFLRLMKNEIRPPRVTVQPNFDVIVESEIYPALLRQTLGALAEEVSAPGGSGHVSVVTLQLKKERVAAELVRRPELDVIALLCELTGRDLPPNVVTELEEWSGHADQFTLYSGFGLLESADLLPQADAYLVERISPRFGLVRQAEALVAALEKAALVPLYVKHAAVEFELLPDAAGTVFPKAVKPDLDRASGPRPPEPVILTRTTLVTLHFVLFPQAFEVFRKALAEARCPIQADASERSITYAQQYQPTVDAVLHQLAEKYRVEIQDVSG